LIHLAKRRELKFPDGSILRTPALIPSFSSRVPKIDDIFRAVEDIVDGPILISAYDVKRGHLNPPYGYGSAVFLDSGGYEASKDLGLSDVGDQPDQEKEWTEQEHAETLSQWALRLPLVVISYDHPRLRLPIADQIRRATQMRIPENALREILMKPETTSQHFIQIESIQKAIHNLASFNIVGITEKEIGNSVFDRMVNIAKLRTSLNAVGIESPIHVFGSLDTITTLLYFVAGADIFDGLTWLRYAFMDGRTLYRQQFGITDIGLSVKSPKVEAVCWSKNYHYLKDMELEMRRFLNSHDFSVFKYHSELLKSALESIEEEVGK